VLNKLPTLSLDKTAAVSPRIRVIDARGKFDLEMSENWPEMTVERASLRGNGDEDPAQRKLALEKARQECDALLKEADVICIGFPYPRDLVARSPRLKWVHQTTAGASNLRYGDIWGSSVMTTNSRGNNRTVPIAEYVMAAVLAFSKGLPQTFVDKQRRQMDRKDYNPLFVEGKTMCIVGLGGIGREVARLAKAFGMRVLATRRSASVRADGVDGVDTLFPPRNLNVMLEEGDFVAICAQSTPETAKIISEAQLRAMKTSAHLINVARGELIDEDALVKALREGWIAGAMLDVYADEFSKPPRDEFWELPNLVLTPHTSSRVEVPLTQPADCFYENLRRFVNGEELLNVIDWERGY
ncbi:D-2-hydroxyacid dehydrogenase, partial [Chloroflexota bacterium]